MGGQEHFYMETQGVIAIPTGEASEIELYVASQHAAYTQVCIMIHYKYINVLDNMDV